MSRFFGKTFIAALLAVAAATFTLLLTAQPASAYNFPFNGKCGAQQYFDGPSHTHARYSHTEGNTLWYKIYWGPAQPVPGDPYHQNNWSSCTR